MRMHPAGRRDFGYSRDGDYRSGYGRSAGVRGAYDDAEEEYDDSSYGYGNGGLGGMQSSGNAGGLGMQSGGTGGRGTEVSSQLNLVAALLAQSLQQQQQGGQSLLGQRQNVLQAAQTFIGRQQQQQMGSGFRDNWPSPAMGNSRGFGRAGPMRGGGGGRGRPGILGDGSLIYDGPQTGEVPSLLDMPPIRAGRGMWSGDSRPSNKRRADDFNETDSHKRRKETGTSDQNRGQGAKAAPKGTSKYTPHKDKADGKQGQAADSSTKQQQQKVSAKAATTGTVGAFGDAQSSKPSAETGKKVAVGSVKKDAASGQFTAIDAAAAASLTYQQGKAYGVDYVVPVTGYFCKLCHKFYSNMNAATVAHCQSEQHFEKFKTALVKKAKSHGAAAEQSAESALSDVPQAASSSASATNAADVDAEKDKVPSSSDAAAEGAQDEEEEEALEEDPDLSLCDAANQSSDVDAKPVDVGDQALDAKVDDAGLGDGADAASPAEPASPSEKSKPVSCEVEPDISAVGPVNESIDEGIEDSPSTARARRGRGRGAAVKRGRK